MPFIQKELAMINGVLRQCTGFIKDYTYLLPVFAKSTPFTSWSFGESKQRRLMK